MTDRGMCQKSYYLLQGMSSFLDVIELILGDTLCECDRLGSAVAINEALTNALIHGNGGDGSKPILMEVSITPCYLMVIIRDCGAGFEDEHPGAAAVPDPWQESGRGLFLIKHYVDHVQFHRGAMMIYKRLCVGSTRQRCPKRVVQ